MARDYVTIREEQRDGETVWTFATVRHDRLKSAPAKVTRRGGRYAIVGAAWGAPIAGVEVRIDDGPWMPAELHGSAPAEAAALAAAATSPGGSGRWTGARPRPASTAITSRAIDVDGNVQPAPDDPFLASKMTFWESNGQITRRVRIPAGSALRDARSFVD